MPTIRFTDAGIRAIRPPRDRPQVEYRDARYPGLVLKVGAGGTKTWAYRSPHRTAAGRRPWAKIGRYPAVSYRDALERYREEDSRTKLGQPPPELKERIRQLEAELALLKRQAHLLTFGQLVDEYHRRHLVKLKEPNRPLRILERDAVRVWRDRPADEIRREDVVKLLDEVIKRGAPVGANRLLVILKGCYNWAIKAQLLKANPATTVEPPTIEYGRDRNLSPREIRSYWFALQGRDDIRPEAANALCLCLVTGQRRSEVAGMRWDELSEDDGGRLWWELSAGRTKATRPTTVYLPPLARALLHRQREAWRVSDVYVFPRPSSLRHPVREDDLTENMQRVTTDLLRTRKITERATVHDLRRTATTMWAKKGIAPRRLQKLMLNHEVTDVTDVYDRYEYSDELAAAWSEWARCLAKLLAPGPP